jgi:hypothetical protein
MDLIVAVLCGLALTRKKPSSRPMFGQRRTCEHPLPTGPASSDHVERIQKGSLKVNVKPERTDCGCRLSVDGKDGFGTAICETSLKN